MNLYYVLHVTVRRLRELSEIESEKAASPGNLLEYVESWRSLLSLWVSCVFSRTPSPVIDPAVSSTSPPSLTKFP